MEGATFFNELDFNTLFDGMEDLVDVPADTDSGSFSAGSSDLYDLLSDPLPYEDAAELEWLSDFLEDSYSDGGLTMPKETIKESSSSEESQASSPMSSGSFSSEEKTFSPHRGIRTKRPRPTTFTAPSFPVPNSQNRTVMIPVIEGKRLPKPRLVSTEDKKKKKMKPTIPMAPASVEANGDQTENVRKCLHCEITKTPQWRAGPMGPKTLCNACGVRYKSGRLFPEYRPAASPTFVASLHSNSHRKVVEMRNRSDEKVPMEMIAQLELIPNTTTPSFD